MDVNLAEVAPLVLVVKDVPEHVSVRKKVFVLQSVLVNGPEVGRNVMLVLQVSPSRVLGAALDGGQEQKSQRKTCLGGQPGGCVHDVVDGLEILPILFRAIDVLT